MNQESQISRRHFLKLVAAGGSSLTLGFVVSPLIAQSNKTSAESPFAPNAWLTLAKDGGVTITVAESEMGQGVRTSMAMLVAEELEVDWPGVRVRQAPVDAVYGWQGTGGSKSVREGWKPLREAGAAARHMLIQAAAQVWNVPINECRTERAHVVHAATDRTLAYKEILGIASQLPVPETVILKRPDEFTLIGRDVASVDLEDKITGRARYGIDVRIPGMLFATVTHCPVFGGRAKEFELLRTKKGFGAVEIVNLGDAVAVLAKDSWTALRARSLLDIQWDFGPHAHQNSERISQSLRDALSQPGKPAFERGDIQRARVEAARVLEATYETPFQAHATMEPMCCTADVRDSGCELWVPTQQPTAARRRAAEILGMDENSVTVNTTLLGGGFGRRNKQDFVEQAVRISRHVRRPVKLFWTREEDIQHDFYHPVTAHRLKAYLDGHNRLTGWEHRVSGVSYTAGADDLPYAVEHIRVDSVNVPTGVPIGPWRSVSYAFNAYAVESFVNELAVATDEDPISYRLALLKDAPRHRRVLEAVADVAGWGRLSPENSGLGAAVHASFGTYVAQVVEVFAGDDGVIRVPRIFCAVDCGTRVHPTTARAQIEGSIVFALTAACKSAITLKAGRVQQSNFHDFPILKMSEMPQIEVLFIDSNEPPGGLGEPAVPPLAPAFANAVYNVTGTRINRLPFPAVS